LDGLLARRIGTLAVLAASATVLCPAPALADELFGVKSLTMAVEGTVAEYCALGDVSDLALGDLQSTARSRSTRVALDCNMPFDVQVSASNGALTHTAFPEGQGPYAGKLAYDIGFFIPTRSPTRGAVRQTFQGADLIGGRTFSSAGGIAVDGMRLTIDLAPAPTGDGALLGGDYSETIEITIAPS
jgi:hypothetical protein